jgi:DNA-binding LytR/AlgR family response regulator
VRVLIVDDQPLARRGVIARLKRLSDMEIIGEFGDGASAAAGILELLPDLVFLDVQMPGMDGFEVLRALPRESLPSIIFLTAHEQYALQAFRCTPWITYSSRSMINALRPRFKGRAEWRICSRRLSLIGASFSYSTRIQLNTRRVSL